MASSESAKPNPLHVFVPVFRVEETLTEIRQCLEKGWTGLGFKTVEIEEAWKAYTGLGYAHYVNSGTAALHLAVRTLKDAGKWQDGDEVISTPLTFVATNHVLLYERLTPVFADVDEHLCLDPAAIERKITPKTRAVMYVGFGGNTGRLEEVSKLCKEKGLKLILDAAHMAGTWLHGKTPGLWADAVCYSFHAVKPLPTADSGIVSFHEVALDQQARRLSWFGINADTWSRMGKAGTYKWRYGVDDVGFKYHGNSIVAAIGLVAMRYLDIDCAYRRQLAGWYDEALRGMSEVAQPPIIAGCESSRHLYPILVDRRDELMVYLNSVEIYPGVHYVLSTEYPMYKDAGACPKAEEASRKIVSLPMHLKLGRKDVARIASAIKDFFKDKVSHG